MIKDLISIETNRRLVASTILVAVAVMSALADGYQTVKITDVESAVAKYVTATNAAGPSKARWVKCPVLWPDGKEPGLKAPDDRKNPRLQLPVELKTTGEYHFWIRHWRNENRHTALEFLLRSPDDECVNYTLVDRFEDMWTDKDAEDRKYRCEAPAGWIWTKVTVGIEYPGRYVVNIGRNTRYVQKGMDIGSCPLTVAECWVTNDPKADPTEKPFEAGDIPVSFDAPVGFVHASHHEPHIMLNSSIADPQKRPPTQLMECYSWFRDPVRYLKYGATDRLLCGEYTATNGYTVGEFDSGAIFYGCSIQANVDYTRRVEDALKKKYPFNPNKPVGPGNEPIGRQQRADGTWGGFSDAFEEMNDMLFESNKVGVARLLARHPGEKEIWAWWTAWEQCGTYDYGPTSREGFRKYLKGLYDTIDALNAEWRTEYKSFDEIEPGYWKYIYGKQRLEDPLEWHRNVANFIDFRDFCSKAYATRIAQKSRAYVAMDPKRRHISSNLSANNLSSVMWMQWRPLMFEDTCQITQKGSDMVGYDNYGTDDLYGATWELFYAFGDGKLRPMVREGAIHAASPELQARSQWHNVAKGMQGQACFCVQEANVGELSKFGMTDMFHGAAPRPKMAAFSDNFRALHHLEYLISETSRSRAVKPIAIYYSAVSHLMTEKPYASIFDCGPDNFFRAYELFHANGYDVTFVTDRQIREGGDWLKGLQAIVFIDASYIPLDVQKKVVDWVQNDGGAILADAQSGSLDGHGYPTDFFTKFLGIQPVQRKKVDESAAEKLAFGYSAYAFDVIDRDALYKTACEVKDAPGGTHPISRKLVKTMVSAMGYNEVKCIKGTQVLQENNGRPYMIVRDEGKGKVAYFAGYFGTMYGAGCTRYEWSDTHSDNSPYRIADAWAEWVGAEKICVNDIPDDRKYGMRFESPLVDSRGNAMLGMVSQLRGPVDSFRVKYKMPAGFKAPKVVLGSVNGTRKLVELPFAYDEKTCELSVRMCGFRCWGNVLALNDIGPFVSVEAVDAKRDAYSLAWFKPGDEVKYKVRVFNPSPNALPAGEVELRLSDGWFCDREKAAVAALPAYGASDEMEFTVKAPTFNSCRKLEPMNFIYRAGMVLSSPAVEMVWFQTEPQNEPAPTFGVE